ELDRLGGRYAQLAGRQLYKQALDAWQAKPDDPALARDVARAGERVLDALGTDPKSLADPAVASACSSVAQAAASVWKAEHDAGMRDLALRLDRALLGAGRKTAESLRRLAELGEAAGDLPGAADAWAQLLAGLPEGQPAWFEAKYNAVRITAAIDPQR